MPNELSEKVYPDGTVVKLRDDTARAQIAERVVKTYSDTSMRNVEANSFVTFTIALNDSVLDAVVGFSISDSVKCVPAICAFQNSKVVTMRVVNTSSSAQGFKVTLYYI